MAKLGDFQSVGDSANLSKIDGEIFTITGVENSDYDDNGTNVPGVKIATKEGFTLDGTEFKKFHTTRVAIVKKLLQPSVREVLENGDTFRVKVAKTKTKNGHTLFVLEDA